MEGNAMFTMKQLFAAERDEPTIKSRLRTDIYKFLMQDFNRRLGVHNTSVTFGLTNRNPEMRLADVIPESYLREQLDHVRSLMMAPVHATFIQGMTVMDGDETHFMYPDPSYTQFMLKQTLCDYDLSVEDGQFNLTFTGTWFGDEDAASHWEIPAMAIISESYVYWYLKRLLKSNDITEAEIQALFAAAYQRVVETAKLFRGAEGMPTFSQFGLRRQVSQDWSWLVQTSVIDEMIPENCVGASDSQMSFDRGDTNPNGTRAHEQEMVWMNLGPDTDNWIRESQFDLDFKWCQEQPRPLRILLPDCLGSEQYYRHAPTEIAQLHSGVRIDSMETHLHDPLYRGWLESHGENSNTKLPIPSDGQNGQKFMPEHAAYSANYRAFSAGMGGAWTNDIKGLLPDPLFRTPNMVIKVWHANGRPCTKIGDSPDGGKITGPDSEHNQRVLRAVSEAGWAEHDFSSGLAIPGV